MKVEGPSLGPRGKAARSWPRGVETSTLLAGKLQAAYPIHTCSISTAALTALSEGGSSSLARNWAAGPRCMV